MTLARSKSKAFAFWHSHAFSKAEKFQNSITMVTFPLTSPIVSAKNFENLNDKDNFGPQRLLEPNVFKKVIRNLFLSSFQLSG